MSDILEPIWDTRPVLAHIRDFARARRVGPTPLLVATLLRAIAATDPNLVLPPVIGGVASLNLIAAFIGPSGHGKGATDAASRAATNIPEVPEFPVGSGEGMARTFAIVEKDDGTRHQEIRRAIFTASEVDGLAAIGSRSGSTLMATIRQIYSGESIGAANAQKHTRLIVPRHGYRACISVGVQPEAAQPLLGDLRGTAQRMVWTPVGDPEAPDVRPDEPEPFEIRRHLLPVDRQTHLELPRAAIEAMEAHHLAKLRGEDVDPLDGHRMLTQAKLAAGFMLLDGRRNVVDHDDWRLAARVMAVSDQTRARLERIAVEQSRRENRARAYAAAERDETMSDRRLQRAKDAVVRWLDKRTEQSMNDLRRRARSDWRADVSSAVAELVDDGLVIEVRSESATRYALTQGSTVDPGSTQDNRRSEGVDLGSTVDPSPFTNHCPKHPAINLTAAGKCALCIADKANRQEASE